MVNASKLLLAKLGRQNKINEFNYFSLSTTKEEQVNYKQHFFLSNFSKVELFENQNNLMNRYFGWSINNDGLNLDIL